MDYFAFVGVLAHLYGAYRVYKFFKGKKGDVDS